MRIVHRLLIGIAVPSLLLGGIGVFATKVGEISLREQIDKASITQAKGVLEEIDKTIHHRMVGINAWSKRTLIQDAMRESNEEFSKIVDVELAIQEEDKRWIAASSQPTQLMSKLMANDLSKSLRTELATFSHLEGFRVLGEAFLTNRYGAVISMTNPTSDYRQDDEEWWQAAMRDGSYVSGVSYDQSAGVYSIDLCVRVDDNNGKPLGVIKAPLNIEESIRILDRAVARFPRESHPRLVLLTSDLVVIHKGGHKDAPLQMDSDYRRFVNKEQDSHVVTDIRVDAKDGREFFSTIVRSQGFSGHKGLGWILVCEFDAERVLLPITRLRKRVLQVFLVVGVVTTLIIIFFSRSFGRRIQQLNNATAEIGRGNFDNRIKLAGSDELVQLSNSVNQMAGDLKRLHQAEVERVALKGSVESMQNVLGIVGHELRTPLAAMRASAELLEMFTSSATEDTRNLVRIIKDELVRMSELVNNLLEAARMDSGVASWEWGQVDLQHALEQAMNVARPLIDPEHINLSYELNPTTLTMHGDHDAVCRLIINFVTNSVKHTQVGSIHVAISGLLDYGQEWIEIVVRDTGEGMSESVIEKLGRAFVLNSGTVGSNYVKGAGLGLAICKSIAEAHGGHISVTSNIGAGSTFTIRLRTDLDEPMKPTDDGNIIRRVAA